MTRIVQQIMFTSLSINLTIFQKGRFKTKTLSQNNDFSIYYLYVCTITYIVFNQFPLIRGIVKKLGFAIICVAIFEPK